MLNYFKLIELLGKLALNTAELKKMTAFQIITVLGSAGVAFGGAMQLRPHDYVAGIVAGLGALVVALGHLVQTSPIGK